jgi:putative nucleotidyltransferase with HDIG domain
MSIIARKGLARDEPLTVRFDSYKTPVGERLLQRAMLRYQREGVSRRALLTEAAVAALFIAAASTVAALGSWSPALAAAPLACAVAAYLVAARETVPVGSGFTRPTQVVFVPMLFMLPLAAVPAVVAACLLLDTWPHVIRRDLSLLRVLARIGDSFYSLGPVLVLIAAGQHRFDWRQWPVMVLALLAQFAFDAAGGLARDWFADGTPPSVQIQLLWLFAIDACLSCVGLLVAASAVRKPALILLTLPLLALLGMFARERQQRLEGTLELSTAYRGTALLLGDVVEGDHAYTGAHSREVVDLAVAVADELRLDPTARRHVEFGALLHDVGKLRVPKSIINKPGKLDDAEWEIVHRHTIEGEAMLRQVGGMLARVGRIVRSSHEHFDGRGYPDGLAGPAIPIESRIVSACDAFSAMTTDRAYRAAMPVADALAELQRCSGTQFDPRVVAALDRQLRAQRAADAATRRPAFTES